VSIGLQSVGAGIQSFSFGVLLKMTEIKFISFYGQEIFKLIWVSNQNDYINKIGIKIPKLKLDIAFLCLLRYRFKSVLSLIMNNVVCHRMI
jgi:hypothetical protein